MLIRDSIVSDLGRVGTYISLPAGEKPVSALVDASSVFAIDSLSLGPLGTDE